MNETPLVSICCITFNHEKFIRCAIEGFLMQETTFSFEIIIHDDASTDKTASIVREFAEKYPNLITPIYQTKNQFSLYGGNINPRFTFPIAKGKYIAMCEGDDYWTDPLKLQKQVESLEADPDYSLCSHESFYTMLNDPKSLSKFIAILYRNYELDGIISLPHLFKLFIFNNEEFWKRRRKSSKTKRYSTANFEIALNTASTDRYIPTLSIVARAEYLKNMPSKLFKLSTGHRLIILWTALFGKQKHLMDVMGVKNTQENSISLTKIHQKDTTDEELKNKSIEMYQILKKYADKKESQLIDQKIKELH